MTVATDNRRMSPPRSAAERLAALAVRRGVSLGALRTSNARDFALVLAAAALAFPSGREMTEREVNQILRGFLADAGAMLATDHVELRRWLVDYHVLARDGFGRVYASGSPGPEIAAFASELAGVDLARLARSARAHDAMQRAERKERWQDAKRKADV